MSAVPLLLSAVLLALTTTKSEAQTQPPGDFINGFDNSTAGSVNSTASWIYWYNGSGSVALDTATKLSGAGSLKVNIPFDTNGTVNVGQGAWFGNFDNNSAYDTTIVYDGTFFTNIECDVLMDPSDPVSASGDYGTMGIGLLDAGTPSGARVAGTITIPGTASNTWFHVRIPVDKTASYLSIPGVIGVSFVYSKYANSFLTNPVIMHIDNLAVHLGAVSNPPPTMSITTVQPGLNFVEGSISGQYDRQNIRTVNTGTLNYSWVGAATGGNPVTYSFNISKWMAPDLNYHIYFNSSANADGASAPDYNATNAMIFQVSTLSNGQAVAQIQWKTNQPSAGATNIAILFTNTALLGNWQLQFTGNTTGTITPPGSAAVPFTLDSTLASSLANPVYVTFGINPSINSNYIVGESVVVSQIGISGVSSMSSSGPVTSDNFLADSALNTNIWEVNALFAASILLVPTNIAYSVDWTIPAGGFVLEENSSLTSPSTWSVVHQPTVVLTPGIRTLVPQTSLPAGSDAFFRLHKLVATKMQVLLQGESNAPNTVSGKTGTPTPVSVGAGGQEVVTINAVDANWNIVPVNGDSISLTSTDTGAILPSSAPFVSGTVQETLLFQDTGSWTISATDAAATYPAAISSSVTVNP